MQLHHIVETCKNAFNGTDTILSNNLLVREENDADGMTLRLMTKNGVHIHRMEFVGVPTDTVRKAMQDAMIADAAIRHPLGGR